jgi:transposase-like protein
MADRLIEPGTAPAKSETTSSPILAMHARYEAAWQEYNQIDVAGTKLDKSDADDDLLGFKYQRAETANNAETDALRQAILYQVPTTWTEAMVLLCHIHIAFDLTDKPTKEDWTATHTALDTLFDFMCCEVDQDHEALGKHFQASANIVFDKRRYRTGIVEA